MATKHCHGKFQFGDFLVIAVPLSVTNNVVLFDPCQGLYFAFIRTFFNHPWPMNRWLWISHTCTTNYCYPRHTCEKNQLWELTVRNEVKSFFVLHQIYSHIVVWREVLHITNFTNFSVVEYFYVQQNFGNITMSQILHSNWETCSYTCLYSVQLPGYFVIMWWGR